MTGIKNKALKRRIIEISYKHKLSHIGSCLEAVDIIKDICDQKKPDEKFVLSQGHAGLALYVVLENEFPYTYKAEKLLKTCGIHPDRLHASYAIDCSTGSLGQGLPIALGMALADRSKNVYCLISDGEMQEGSIYEAFRIKGELRVENLRICVNDNAYGGYGSTGNMSFLFDRDFLDEVVYRYHSTNVNYLPFLKGLEGHYHTMTEDDYKLAMEVLK